jgi:hypothetical protein
VSRPRVAGPPPVAVASAVASRPAPAPSGSPTPAGGGSGGKRAPKTRQAVRIGQQATRPEFANYQGVILAEFVLAELLVSASPIVTRKNQPGLSPYIPRDITKMLSIGLLYFLLELAAVGNAKWGRMGAWFGGLILLAVGLSEAASVTNVLNLFGGGAKQDGTDQSAAQAANAADTIAGDGSTPNPIQASSGEGVNSTPAGAGLPIQH